VDEICSAVATKTGGKQETFIKQSEGLFTWHLHAVKVRKELEKISFQHYALGIRKVLK
jgi:hypothetical protein